MSWISNHSLNSILTGARQLHHLQRCFNANYNYCQDAGCLNMLLQRHSTWLGVYASDKLPQLSNNNSCVSLIVNSAPSSTKGEHWLAIRVQPDCVEFFDSYGHPPWKYPTIYEWIKGLNKARTFSLKQRIQGEKAYCGAYCFYFLSERPFSSSLFATLFENPRYIFTSLDADTHHTSALIKQYLSLNDSVVFDYLHRYTQDLLSMFDDNEK